ncbi:hypothetical protein [Emticicia sp. 17c]|uniref:hypothetical protein n=1 Tax=Emticicia sp. 17c TaxID=3127704 RepID=UPI00301CA96C
MEAEQKPKTKPEESQTDFPGYPLYPSSEDIYSRGIKEDNINPDDTTQLKDPADIQPDDWNESDYNTQQTGDDLDVPGADLDDDSENIGLEDEENNYYSLGGDNHEDLEETNDDLVSDKD